MVISGQTDIQRPPALLFSATASNVGKSIHERDSIKSGAIMGDNSPKNKAKDQKQKSSDKQKDEKTAQDKRDAKKVPETKGKK